MKADFLFWFVAAFVVTSMTFAEEKKQTDLEALRADRVQFKDRLRDIYYLTTANIDPEARESTERMLNFTCASTSRQVVIERCKPTKITPTLYRIDLLHLGWQKNFGKLIVEHYPYRKAGAHPVLIRADWFITFAWREGYYDLLHQERPADSNQLYQIFKADVASIFSNSWVETESGVAIRTRLIRNFPTTQRADLWRTFDLAAINQANDPLQQLLTDPEGAYSEWISPLPKLAAGEFVFLQEYALTDQNNKLAEAAPPDVVVDRTMTRRNGSIENAQDCLSCHGPIGLIPPTVNSVERLISSGAEIYTNEQQRLDIERRYLANLKSGIEYHNQRYKLAIEILCGCEPQQISLDFQNALTRYDRGVTIEVAAVELGTNPNALRTAFVRGGSVPARLAQLPHIACDRELWQDLYPIALDLVANATPGDGGIVIDSDPGEPARKLAGNNGRPAQDRIATTKNGDSSTAVTGAVSGRQRTATANTRGSNSSGTKTRAGSSQPQYPKRTTQRGQSVVREVSRGSTRITQRRTDSRRTTAASNDSVRYPTAKPKQDAAGSEADSATEKSNP